MAMVLNVLFRCHLLLAIFTDVAATEPLMTTKPNLGIASTLMDIETTLRNPRDPRNIERNTAEDVTNYGLNLTQTAPTSFNRIGCRYATVNSTDLCATKSPDLFATVHDAAFSDKVTATQTDIAATILKTLQCVFRTLLTTLAERIV